MELKGKYGNAIVHTDDIEQEAISQIINLLNQPMAKDANVRIMPDVHAGAGCVIGYTAKLTDKVVPNLIGVDINCGLLGYNLGNKLKLKFDKLDKFIRRNIPSGREINSDFNEKEILNIWGYLNNNRFKNWNDYKNKLIKICNKTNQDSDYVLRSIGSMGGGNHYLEIGEDDHNNDLWLIVHSGSRNFGLKIAKYHQGIAEESLFSMTKEEFNSKIEDIKKKKKGKGIEVAIKALRKEASSKEKSSGLEHIEGKNLDNYLEDMEVAQIYAELNRYLIIYRLINNFYNIKFNMSKILQTNHNYISFNDNIIRKGAVSAHKNELLFIPMNMAYGTLLCRGKGNPNFNFSAPHGAGRLMSRSKAKMNIRLEDFEYKMKQAKVWTTCVNKSTLDESPQAYKKPKNVIKYLEPTVEIISTIKPLYNYKANQ